MLKGPIHTISYKVITPITTLTNQPICAITFSHAQTQWCTYLHHLFHYVSHRFFGPLGSTCPWHILCRCCHLTVGKTGHRQSQLSPFFGHQRDQLPPTQWWWTPGEKVLYHYSTLVSRWRRRGKHWGNSPRGRILPIKVQGAYSCKHEKPDT